MSRLIYLDNAATTQVYPEVVDAMLPYFTEHYGNPSAIYSFADEAERAVDHARGEVADLIGAKKDEIYFTGGGSESDNWALKATAEAYAAKGKHIITSAIEHHAILHTAQWLEKHGFEVTYVGVDEDGKIKLDELKAAIRPDTILISVMAANNEIGTIQPLKEIGEIAKEHGILFHTDAVQAFGHIPINVDDMHIDMLSASGHKINGPKGIGVMYIRKGVKIRSFIHGGAQERQRRAGTHNVPGIVGLGKAVELAKANMAERSAYETKLRDHLIERVTSEIPYTRLNGHRTDRLPNNANFCFRFIEGESMLILLDQAGICGSSGSACTSGSLDPSHVLLAIGLPHEIAHGSLRLSLGEDATIEDADYVVDELKEMKIPVLRWPGGCFADEYHWMDGIGPKEKRKKMINTHWGGVVEDNSFGTHEFFELCRQLGCKTYVNGILVRGTVREMSEWVEYITFNGVSPMADLRKENGHEDPWTIDYFGVGNENWGCGGNMRPEHYADEYRRYQTYVRNYAGNQPINKICCGPNVDDYEWTKKVMATCFDH